MADPICWLDTVEPEHADGPLAGAHEQVRRSDGLMHNLFRAMSLRPEPIRWADGRYPREMWFPTLPGRSEVDMWRESGSAWLKDRLKARLHDVLESAP